MTNPTGSIYQEIAAREAPAKVLTKLRIMSYNVQVGIRTESTLGYLLNSWRHLFPDKKREENLDGIARLLTGFDIVALQEVDGGSWRSGNVNQVEYLAQKADFPYWYSQRNRNLGRVAQHSNGVLTRLRPQGMSNHRLPGWLRGRGAVMLQFGEEKESLLLILAHLSLGRRTRAKQLQYITQLVKDRPNVIVMGDLNCNVQAKELECLSTEAELNAVNIEEKTFPSWAPQRNLDHIWVSPSLSVNRVEVLQYRYSDHLPIAIELAVPSELLLHS